MKFGFVLRLIFKIECLKLPLDTAIATRWRQAMKVKDSVKKVKDDKVTKPIDKTEISKPIIKSGTVIGRGKIIFNFKFSLCFRVTQCKRLNACNTFIKNNIKETVLLIRNSSHANTEYSSRYSSGKS